MDPNINKISWLNLLRKYLIHPQIVLQTYQEI